VHTVWAFEKNGSRRRRNKMRREDFKVFGVRLNSEIYNDF
jgi:hypothetical protein